MNIHKEKAGEKTAEKKRKAEREKHKKRLFSKISRKEQLTPEELLELEIVGYHLSKRYDYLKLMKAANTETAVIEGREVHGYMKIMYPNYDWLIVNDVLDVACHFATMEFKAHILQSIKDYDFEHAIVNVLPLPEIVYFDYYPEFKFNKIVILTQDVPFENAVTWLENEPWIDEDGYDTTVTLAPCNFLNAGFPLWDLPVTILKDAVGMDKIFFDIKAEASDLIENQQQILAGYIYKTRQEEITLRQKLDEKDIAYAQLEEKHEYMKDNIRAGDTTRAEEKIEKLERRFDRKRSPVNYTRLITYLAVFIIVCFVIIGIIAIIYNIIPKTGPIIPETAGVLNIFTGGG